MTRAYNNIQESLLRMILCLVVMFLYIGATAQTMPTSGDGTPDNPYQVSTMEHLKWIAENNSKWTVSNGNYIQTKDIDCGGAMLPTIALPNGGTSPKAFEGTYNGQGYAIRNFKLDWTGPETLTNESSKYYAFGLFGYVTGKLKNIIIDGATMSRRANARNYTTTNEIFYYVGVLAGKLAGSGVVENVMIFNSEINDGGTSPVVTNYSFGGAIGDVASNISGSGAVSTTIRCVYADVDILLPNVTRDEESVKINANRHSQYHVGGITGRIRTANSTEGRIPVYTLYTGTIDAPYAMVGPCYGGSRYSTDGYTRALLTAIYTGMTGSPGTVGSKEEATNLAKSHDYRYYLDYQVKHYDTSSEGVTTKITDFIPDGAGCKYATRTFKANYAFTDMTLEDVFNPANMAAYQGINRGKHVNGDEAMRTALENINNKLKAANYDYSWIYDGTSTKMLSLSFDMTDSWPRDFALTIKGEGSTISGGFTYSWSLTDAATGQTMDGWAVNADKLSATVNGKANIDRKLTCIVTDYLGNKHTVESLIPANEDAALTITKDDATGKCQVAINGNPDLTAQTDYTITGWMMIGEDGASINFNHLNSTITLTDKEASIIIDQTFITRRLIANYIKSDGSTGEAYLSIEPLTSYGISGTELPYKAEINGTTNVAVFGAKTYRWEILFDDGSKKIVSNSNTLTESDLGVKKETNAIYTLTIIDPYGNWATSIRILNDTRNVKVTNTGTGLTAEIPGVSPGEGTWTWRGINGDIFDDISKADLLTEVGQGTSTLDFVEGDNDNYSVYIAIWTSDDQKSVLVGYYTTKNIIYVFNKTHSKDFQNGRFREMVNVYPDGNDDNNGRTPETAVRTMKRAYELLSTSGNINNNTIVVMGYLADDEFLRKYMDSKGNMVEHENDYKRNTTITGAYGNITDGVLKMCSDGSIQNSTKVGYHYLRGATQFKDITFYGAYDENNKSYTGMLFLYCHLNDITIAGGVKIEGYQDYKANEAGINDSPAPYITIVGGFHNYDNPPLVYPAGNKNPGENGSMRINIASGCWGRIIASARNDGDYNKKSNNIFGHPDQPHRVEVNINIKHSAGKGLEEFAPDQAKVTSTALKYKYDIGLLTGGQTDGTVYVESKQTMLEGKVGRYISGNISFGRAVTAGNPADSFYGSTELTLEGGEIGELVGGTLGRQNSDTKSKTSRCYAYFYGRSILNINAGTINNNIYGAGSGGVTGLGDDDHHTKDATIPYYNGNKDAYGRNEVAYGDYSTVKGKMPLMPMQEEGDNLVVGDNGKQNLLDLAKSYCEINVNGGTINGNVYGGGYGYSVQVDINKALDQSGDLFGNSIVNINGGTVKGNVYGGGAGSSEFYKKASAANKKDFEDLACIFGKTQVNIKGGIIEGRVYAGSQGITGFPEMATLYGNTNLTIENQVDLSDNTTRIPIINGNIYGGSELGRINGNTNVNINGGALGNCIFAGSEGIEDGENATIAYIDGSTNLRVTGGTYFTEDHIKKISADNKLQLTPANRTFNIYGGGYRNCVITGDTHVYISKSLLSSYKNLLEGHTFQQCIADEAYRKFSVYAAGRGILTDVLGNANLDINIEDGASVPSTVPQDIAEGQQFFMISGGGFAGNVYGNSYTRLTGKIFATRAYGGGMYGRIEGKTELQIYGGSYHNVYGGGLLGDIKKGANLIIGVQADPNVPTDEITSKNRNIYIYENVYGGNDVGGIVGYEQARDDDNNLIFWTDRSDGSKFAVRYFTKDNENKWVMSPNELDYTLHSSSEYYGVNMCIFGGTIKGDVYGAGNGDHTGYYVPNQAQSEHHAPGTITRMKYHEGPAYLYRFNTNDPDHSTTLSLKNEKNKIDWALYEYRPRVRRVRMHIGGNSETDRVNILGNVFGGGHACTIGKFNPTKDVLSDPSRFEGKGSLKINFGSHVTVNKGVYMGSRGDIIGKQAVIEPDHVYDETTLNSDYDYHYFDKDYVNKDGTKGCYLLGFPNTLDGRKRFHAYMKLIDMDAKTQLTFYENPETTVTETIDGVAEELPDLIAYNPETFDSNDLRWGNFFAGGARGSMTYNDPDDSKPCYEYTLPKGLTIETNVVGGSEDAQVVYYQYSDDYKSFDTSKPIFTYDGGVVFDDNDGVNSFGGGVLLWDNAPEGTDPDELTIGDEHPRGKRIVMKMVVNCDFDPQMSFYTDENGNKHDIRYGGLVYGGCYNSGITNGSVDITCTNNLLGEYYNETKDFKRYISWSTLRHNIGRVYGGGFGENASIWGETHVTLDKSFRGFNVFGGGMKGHVTHGTHITVKGLSTVYNAVYGGSMEGHVGYDPLTKTESSNASGTHLELISGGIDRIYGGAFMGDVYGGTHITISDEKAEEIVTDGQIKGPRRLLIGSVFGGNDVSGNVYEDKIEGSISKGLCTDIKVTEVPRESKKNYILPSKDDSGKYYGGYPLVGTIYGAGNGNMGDYIAGVTIDRDNECYNGGAIHIANGDKANIDVMYLGTMGPNGTGLRLPNVDKTRITVNGGTIINLYGGGSMCTAKVSDEIIINYTDTVARAAVATANQDPMTWGVLRLFEDLQQREVMTEIGDNSRFSYQIYRVFGGNNLMDMDIQPTWNLKRGHLFSVYSGGNFGKMTYPEGLTLDIKEKDIYIESVYGGGRVGDIDATDASGNRITFGENKYGATLNISDGIIGDVYGGNNVAGTVYNGTNVNIYGAISGNVYGSGNGNYIYYYDHDNTQGDPSYPGLITEGYDAQRGGRYFILPQKEAYPGRFYGDSDEEKILAINRYRPNVDKAFLNIQGSAGKKVFVLGDVYCGGNSSSVLYDPAAGKGGNIKFEIGSHVTLGGVFLGSNGESLAKAFNINNLAILNGIDDMSKDNEIETLGFDTSKLYYNDKAAYDTGLYPNLLSLYMRAAEVTALPKDFKLPVNTEEAYIGNFTIGGRRGSMMTDETISLTLPENLTIFGRIVGGCYDSRVSFYDATAIGGMIKPLKNGDTDKVNLTIKSKFRPWRMVYDAETHKVDLVNDRTDLDGNYVSDDEAKADGTYYYREGLGNIFGGCFTSGKTVGGIKIDLYSDVLGRYEQNDWTNNTVSAEDKRRLQVDRDMLMNNVNLRRTVYALIGAGYGPLSEVEGSVRLRLMPKETSGTTTSHPSISTIFGGSHDGRHVGNSTTEVRDGMVFSSLYGGSRSALKYGSSEVIIGYPKYYKVRPGKSATFTLDRADKYSYVAQAAEAVPDAKNIKKIEKNGKTYYATNNDGTPVIKETVKYREGDIVAANVYEQITGIDKDEYFEEVLLTPTDFGTEWSNININIGDNSQMNNPDAHFYGGGGIYGGGHALNGYSASYSGINTQLDYTKDNNPDNSEASEAIGYGGNSTITVGDNTADDETTSHISIGTGHYVKVKIDANKGDKIGKYALIGGKFIHQSSGKPDANTDYYEMKCDGGIHGDGRRTFVQNFRAVDISGYGYADYTPQSAKLINTFQRIDLLSLNDCCLQLQGALDYATNTIDATYYSIARIGELRMNSSLKDTDIHKSEEDANVAGNLALNNPRSRNYLGFFKDVHYIGALYSNVSFDSKYRGVDGVKQTGESAKSYKEIKKEHIADYETAPSPKSSAAETAFKKRNLGTSPNMVGINNGFSLRLQNVFTLPTEEDTGTGSSAPGANPNPHPDNNGYLEKEANDQIYYGPVIGVIETKLLTLAQDEGGGYIYAFNHHEDKTGTGATGKTFLEDTGNFVYPAAIDAENDNYIVDDCYTFGYYDNQNNAENEEVHYWYVQGHHYYFNTTLTAYTYNNDIDFHLKNDDNLILLSGISATKEAAEKTIKVESVLWEEHEDDNYDCALTNNLTASSPTDSREQYKLYLTIDGHTKNYYTTGNSNSGNAFVARIPNGNDDNGGYAYGTDNEGKIIYENSYSDKSATEKNSPLLGIHLYDTDHENRLPEFFHQHLEDPDNVVITIKAKDSEDKENTYTIRLNIVYLQGPYIEGKVQVENCALPGEFIYANTGNITIEMDDALTVTGKKWYLYPKIKPDLDKEEYLWDKEQRVDVTKYMQKNAAGDINRLELPARYYQNDWKLSYSIVVNEQDFDLQEPEETGDDRSNRITVHNYHRMSTVAKAVKDMKRPASGSKPAGDATNYGYNLDLDLVGGALVYIEDNKDFEIFTKYVNYCNSIRTTLANPADESKETVERMKKYTYKVEDGALWQTETDNNGNTHDAKVLHAKVLPGYNPKAYITGFKNNRTILGYNDDEDVRFKNIKDPSGAENIQFVLNTDVITTKDCMPMTEFRGILNGNGHRIIAHEDYVGDYLIDKNYGEIHYLGVESQGGEDGKPVINENYGTISNSYYYFYKNNHKETGDYSGDNDHKTYSSLVGDNKTDEHRPDKPGQTDNCYQNTNRANADKLTGVLYRSNQSYQYGTVAYNLNQEYLQARYNSKDNDSQVRENIIDAHNGSTELIPIDYLYNFYADGDYRYAHTHSVTEHPEGLRLSDNDGIPNYENKMDNELSMHNTEHPTDALRLFQVSGNKIVERDEMGNIKYEKVDGVIKPRMTDKGYFPIYLYDAANNLADHSDFIFFGQQLTTDTDYRDYIPVRINSSNRVYRAGGSYSTRADHGFHFNREAYALQPTLTAIDFTGHYDLRDKTNPAIRQYAAGWNYYLYDKQTDQFNTDVYMKLLENNGKETISRETREGIVQFVYYPPVLDLPGGDSQKNLHNIASFAIVSNETTQEHDNITKNLLVYTPAVGDEADKFNAADNDRLFKQLHYTRMQSWAGTETAQDDIIGHHLQWVDHGAGGSHFHAWGGLFHLVDKQDFNAPIEFYVASDNTQEGTTGRAWYLRKPDNYATLNDNKIVDGFKVSNKAWESLALPFTCNRVFAVNSEDYIEKYSRGEITHFYGNDEATGITNHDYWLRGMVKADADGCGKSDKVVEMVTFARPGSDDGLFKVQDNGADMQMRGDYKYQNDWFLRAYQTHGYATNHDQYSKGVTFTQYDYITKNAPYIVAYPGPDYKEFDLKGDFYNVMNNTTGCNEQEILYEFTVEQIDPNNNFDSQTASVRIPVTDVYDGVRRTELTDAVGTKVTHHATFSRIAGDDITDNMYILNPVELSDIDIHGDGTTFPAGSVFVRVKHLDEEYQEILPFRTYITVEPTSSPVAKPYLIIGNGTSGIDNIGEYEEEQQEDSEPEYRGLNIYVQDNNLVITSDRSMSLPLYGVSGQLFRHLQVNAGYNIYRNLHSGVYIVLKRKFVIRK